MDEDDGRRGDAISGALPRFLREWAAHHVSAFEQDVESAEHVLWSDYNGEQLSIDARRAVHEEARRRGIRAKSTDGPDGTRGVALVRARVADDDDCDSMKRRRHSPVDVESQDDDLDLDEFDRWAELHGYVDLRCEPFDLHSELQISKENSNPAGRARAAYHKFALKCHPSPSTVSSCGFCDSCQCVLQFGRWLRANVRGVRGQDFCKTCVTASRRITGREYDRRRTDAEPLVVDGEFVVIKSLDDVGAERSAYESRSERGVTKAVFYCKRLQRLGVAFNVLKDRERLRLYTDLGWEALVKSEKHSELDVFDQDGFSMYESFFAGEDEEDRQYLLLCPEAESDDESDAENAADDEVENEIENLLESDMDRLERLPRKTDAVDAVDAFPKPSISVLMADPTLQAIRTTEVAAEEDHWASLAARLESAAAEEV